MVATVTAFPPRIPMHAGLLDSVRTLIDHGHLLPGTHIPERTLCERFNVSRTPLRECLKVLAAEGLVELQPNRGARVATLDDGHLRHLFEVIAALEAEAGRLACTRITEPQLADITALHYRMYAHFLRTELPEYFALNQAIHAAILDAAANPVLATTHTGLAARITRARFMSNRIRPDRWQAAMDEHTAILAALTTRDAPTLARLLAEHLHNKRDIITAALPTQAASARRMSGSTCFA